MFHQEQCDLCGNCLVKCQWIDADKDQAVGWMTEMMAGAESVQKKHAQEFVDRLAATGAKEIVFKGEIQ